MDAWNVVPQYGFCLKLWVTKGAAFDLSVPTGFTGIPRRFMHASQMSLHLGDCESLLTNGAELAYLFMDLLSVVSDIVNSFSTHFASS